MGFLETMLLVAKYITMKISELEEAKSRGPFKTIAVMHRAIGIAVARRDAGIERKLAGWKRKIGNWNKAFWLLGILTATEELIRFSYVAEEKYAAGEFSSPEAFQEYREYLWGQYALTWLTPAIVRKLRITSVVMWFVRIIVSAMTAAGTVVGAGTGVGAVAGATALVAEQAFFTALQLFLQSDAATEFLQLRLFKPLVFLGMVPEAIWNELAEKVTGTNAYKDAAERKQQTPQPATQPAPSNTGIAQANNYTAASKQVDAQPEPTGSILDREIY